MKTAFEPPDAIILSHPRSGTHFLQASVASHPKVYPRDEFMRQYAHTGTSELSNFLNFKNSVYTNKSRRFNIGIVMYQDVKMFERLFCPLAEVKVIHLLRNPLNVARSFAQLWADRLQHEANHRNHYDVRTEPLPHAPLSPAHVREILTELGPQYFHRLDSLEGLSSDKCLDELRAAIESMQCHYQKLLEPHPAKFMVSYDEITGNSQVNKLPETFCREILDFLGLKYRPLINSLRKTGQS